MVLDSEMTHSSLITGVGLTFDEISMLDSRQQTILNSSVHKNVGSILNIKLQETDTVKILDDFMKSPRNNRKSVLTSSVLSGRTTTTNPGRDSKIMGSATKRCVIVVSKCYNMLCGNCCKNFKSKATIELQLLEIILLEIGPDD